MRHSLTDAVTKAPAKRWQHLNATYPAPAKRLQHLYATGPTYRNIVWAQHVVRVWSPCYDVLGVENRTSAHAQAQHCCTNPAKRLQHHATCANVA